MEKSENIKISYSICCIVFTAILLFLSCGIDEYYYLPQISEDNIEPDFNTDARVTFQSINQFYYANGYSIFYRIYLSSHFTGAFIQPDEMRTINPGLLSDYNAILPSTDPTNSNITPTNLFLSRNYYEIELDGENISNILSKDGGTINIRFSSTAGDIPAVSQNNDSIEFYLKRSGEFLYPIPDHYFRNSIEFRNSVASDRINNADVQLATGTDDARYAYVNMYIVAIGVNPVSFATIYGKPTHISVFKLPDE